MTARKTPYPHEIPPNLSPQARTIFIAAWKEGLDPNGLRRTVAEILAANGEKPQ